MITAIADTHVVIWYFSGDPKLSARARQFIDDAANKGNEIAVSSISLVEMVYLVEKGRIPAQRFSQLAEAFDDADHLFVEIPVNLKISRALSGVEVQKVPDMPDRIVAATALLLNVPVISRDGKIRLSGIQTIW